MPEFCTCGAKLPEDARFCHKCGKPQRESDIPVEEPAPPPTPEIAPPDFSRPQLRMTSPPPAVGFRSGLTVRSALVASLLGFFVFAVVGQISPLLSMLAMVAAGIFAVFLYRRRTGLPVSLRAGIHIGWITGLFSFVTAMLLVTVMAVALMDKNFASVFESQLGARSNQDIARQVLETFRSPKGVADVLASFFVACGVMPTLGGALGALFGRKG